MRLLFVSFFVGGLFFFLGIPVFAATIPNDPLFGNQWYLQKIHAPEAWDATTGSRDVIVAVIDSGVGTVHEDLSANMWVNDREIDGNGIDDDGNGYVDDRYGWDFIAQSPNPHPKFQNNEEVRTRPIGAHHGTLVAGLIGAEGNNAKGIAGVVWHVRLMPLRALSSSGRGDIQTLVQAIDYAAANGASVINLSIDTRIRSTLLLSAVRRAYAKGVVVVAAAGNESEDGNGSDLDVAPLYPVCAGSGARDYVIGVAATDRNDHKVAFSHFGARCIDIAAPGVDIVSTMVRAPAFGLDALYGGPWSGTSFATALVSGAAALLKSADPSLSPAAIEHFLKEGADDLRTADPVYGAKLGSGRLNIARSLALLQSPEDRTRILQAVRADSPSKTVFAFAFMNGRDPVRVATAKADGSAVTEWFPFSPSYRKSINLMSYDMNNDEHSEIIVSGGAGGGPHVRIFDTEGALRGQFFAYEPSYRGGVSIAVGDPNPDGKKEIIAFPGAEHVGEASILSESGEEQLTFFPFGDAWLDGGAVRVGDVDGDGIDDIVIATKRSGTPHVRVFTVLGEEKFSFTAYTDDVGPMSLALADVDGDGIMEIVTARGEGDPEVRVWKKTALVANFFAYDAKFRGGVVVAGGDTNGDGLDEIVAVPRSNGGPQVKVFSGEGVLLRQFFAREKGWRGGMVVTVLQP